MFASLVARSSLFPCVIQCFFCLWSPHARPVCLSPLLLFALFAIPCMIPCYTFGLKMLPVWLVPRLWIQTTHSDMPCRLLTLLYSHTFSTTSVTFLDNWLQDARFLCMISRFEFQDWPWRPCSILWKQQHCDQCHHKGSPALWQGWQRRTQSKPNCCAISQLAWLSYSGWLVFSYLLYSAFHEASLSATHYHWMMYVVLKS